MNTMGMVTPAAATRTRPAGDRDGSGDRGDSCYFPGCRKDANCHCEICLASINATRDLVPSGSTVPRGSISKLWVSRRPAARRTDPVPFEPESPPSMPRVGSSIPPPATPPTREDSSEGCVTMKEKTVGKGERSLFLTSRRLSLLVGLLLLWAADVGFSTAMLRGLGQPKLTPEVVQAIGEEARVLGNDLNGRLSILRRRMEAMLREEVSDCGSPDSVWELNQDGLFSFQWKCSMYKSMSEKVTIWGSPLKTAGLLTTGFASRSMTLLSGEIVEWSDGRIKSRTRPSNNSSWFYGKWSSAALQLDLDTWVLEYERSSPFLGRGVLAATLETLRLRASNRLMRLKANNFRLLAFDALFRPYLGFQPSRSASVPPT